MTQPAHILVIRLSALGDVAMVVPVLRVFIETFPHVKITVLSRKFYKPLFDEVSGVQVLEANLTGKHKGILGLKRLASEIQALPITHIADLHDVLRSKILRRLLSKKTYKIEKIDKGRKEKKALTRAKNKIFIPLQPTIERYASVFEKLGFPINLQQHHFPVKKPLKANLLSVFTPGKTTIGIAPFAAHAGKMYPLNLMKEVIRLLSEQHPVQLLLFGGKNQEAALEEIAQKYDNTRNLAGKYSFADELQIISHLDTMLAMDSGNAHLAAIYGVKTITLWGVTHPYAGFYPFNQPPGNALMADRKQFPLIPTSVYGNKYPKNYENAMRTISPERVVEKVMTR